MITYKNGMVETSWYDEDGQIRMAIFVDGTSSPIYINMDIIKAVRYARAYVAGLELRDAVDGIRGRKEIYARDVVTVEITGV